jgi:NAD(P)-dependent dehydrogenase (short-subunit alcohol dehydrogenase family)/aryl carrier-like protein
LAPRLALAGPADIGPPALDPEGTVLITGGTGALGAVLVRHLITEYGVRHLVLASRDPSSASDQQFDGLPGEITPVACDVSDRAAVDELVATCGPRLTAVFHLAGVLDDGVLTAMSEQRLDAVLGPKADAAWHLHEATRGLDLAAFVLYSSASGVLGRPGQANYAAANAFLDALATHRTAHGWPGQSLAWGPWSAEAGKPGMFDQVTTGGRAVADGGVRVMTAAQGQALLDRALRTAEPVLVPILLDARLPAGTPVPAILSAVPSAPAGRPARGARPESGAGAVEAEGWRELLRDLPPAEREPALARLIHAEIAAVLGYEDPAALPTDRNLTDVGLDSLGAVQLRNRLSAFTGVRLAATVVFDHPTLAGLTGHTYASMAVVLPAPARPAVPERFTAIYHRVIQDQGPAAAIALRYLASYGLPTFGADERAVRAIAPVRLATGAPEQPILVFLPGYLAPIDPAPVDLARALDGEYDLHLLSHPGFGADRAVPDTVETLVKLHADTVRHIVGNRPYVLIGDSTGGSIAYAVAAELTRGVLAGAEPADGVLAGGGLAGAELTGGKLTGICAPPVAVILVDSHEGSLSSRSTGTARPSCSTASSPTP